MKIIVAGCGKIGMTLLQRLAGEQHDCTALDKNPGVVRDCTNACDVYGVVGNGADYEALKEAGVADCDLFIATMPQDDTNMLSCFLAKQLGAKLTFARIRNPEYEGAENDSEVLDFLKKSLQLDHHINPDKLAARELFNMLKYPSAAKIEKFSGESLEMFELRVRKDSPLNQIPLNLVRSRFPARYLVCAVQRGDLSFIPTGQSILQSGDVIGITASPREMESLLRQLGLLQKESRSVMIVGGSRTAYYLTKQLIASGMSVKIIEKDADACQQLSSLLGDRCVVIHGDGSNHDILREEGIGEVDAFVALTGMDEQNILLSVFASSCKVKKVIPKVSREELAALARDMGLESVVQPHHLVSDSIVRYARARENSGDSRMEALYRLMDGNAEAMEFSVTDECTFTGIPLAQLELKRNILIGGIIRGRTPILPGGSDTIEVGDRVIVISSGVKLSALSDIRK